MEKQRLSIMSLSTIKWSTKSHYTNLKIKTRPHRIGSNPHFLQRLISYNPPYLSLYSHFYVPQQLTERERECSG